MIGEAAQAAAARRLLAPAAQPAANGPGPVVPVHLVTALDATQGLDVD